MGKDKGWIAKQIKSAKAALAEVPEHRRKHMRFTGGDRRHYVNPVWHEDKEMSNNKLKWFTTDQPLPDGWYWHKKDCQSNDEAIIVEVYTGLATKITKWRGQAGSWPVGGDRFDGIPSPDNNYYVRYQWAGPITRPEE